MKYLILCGSVTAVFRAKECFDKSKVFASIGRAPAEITAKHGCSYTIETGASPEDAVRLLQKCKITPTHIYASVSGRIMEVSP